MISPIDEIKNRLDIVEVIGSYIKLKKAGSNYKALCPFHSEKNPSLFVSPTRQIWHCFGCGNGGNIFKFVMMIEGVEFGDALRILAKRAGVQLKPIKPELITERQRLYDILELATKFFEKQLEGKKGKEVLEYLSKRGISKDSVKKWRIGWAPESWHALTNFLVSRGFKREEIERAGLAIKNEAGNFYDRFRGRIIFPIFDLNGQVVGFGGRIFKKEEGPKYINTPNTLLYDKSKILYGLDRAKLEIKKKDFCVLVEGYTDVIFSHQAGIENTVSTSGTALTPYQLEILKRYSQNLLLAFDMDLAGDFATKRGIDLAQFKGFNIKVAILPKEKDPADIISENPEDWQKIIEKAKPIMDFYFESAFSKFDPKKLEGKKEISKILLPPLKRIQSQIEKSFWISKIARALEVRERDIEEEMAKIKLQENFQEIEIPAPKIKKTRKELLEERLLSLIMKKPENLNSIDENHLQYFSPMAKEILVGLKEKRDFKKADSELLDFYNFLCLKSEIEQIEEEKILPEIKFCLKEIQSFQIKKRLDEISIEIKKAEREGDFKRVEKLTEEFNKIAKNFFN